MDAWTFNWLFWLGGFFLVYELVAVIIGGRTLSRQTWNWFSLGQHKVHYVARRVVFLVFTTLLIYGHFYLQWPALWSVVLPGVPFAGVIALSTFVWKDATTSQGSEEPHMGKRLLTAAGWGVAALMPLLWCATCKFPSTFDEVWRLAGVFVAAAYAAFKSNQTVLAPNRPVWSEEKRFEERNKQ